MPSPEIVTDVAEQLLGLSVIAHNLKSVFERGNEAEPGVSFVNGVVLCAVLKGPEVVSGNAVGIGGSPTVGVMFAETFRFNASVTWYAIGIATVPVKVGSGLNVTVPSALTV